MRSCSICVRAVACLVCAAVFSNCVWLHPQPHAELELAERPTIAILPVGFEVEITKLSSVKSVTDTVPSEEEAKQLATALQEIGEEARWLLQSRLAAGQGFRFVPDEEMLAMEKELGLIPGRIPASDQLAKLRARVGADLIIVANIQDYGKVRWLWAAGGMFADMTAETIIIGLASAWNPTIILANVGFELLTSTPVWFGGAYVFGVAFRPVRVEARAIETLTGYPVWQDTEVAVFAWGELKQLPESERDKKESQLRINLETAMEGLADSLIGEGIDVRQLREHYAK